MDQKIKKTFLQELRELCKNNEYLSKALGHLGLVSLVLGIVGFFVMGIMLGLCALLFGYIALEEKQRYAILGIILGVAAIIGVFAPKMISNPDVAAELFIRGIVFAIFGTVYILYRNYKSRKEE